MRFPSALLVVFAAAVACAQTAVKDPAPALDVPTQSRAAKAQLPLTDAVTAALDGRGDPGRFVEAGPEAVVALEQVVNASAQPVARRVRALELLGKMNDPGALAPVQRVLRDVNVEPRLRAAAAVAFAQRTGAPALSELGALLSDDSPVLRIAAARALAAIATDEARTTMEARLASEPDREVREALQHALMRTHP